LTPLPSPSITVVIPTFNERENLRSLIPRLLALGPAYRIVVVDDSSPDGTGALADQLAAEHPGRVQVLHRPKKEGIGPAYVAGFRTALAGDAALIAEMDADHSHDPADLVRLVAAAERADVVLGSRYVPGGRTVGWPRHRRLLSRFGGLYAGTILGVPIADLTSGFKVFRRAALEALDLDAIRSDGYAFQIETTYRLLKHGFTVVEVPIVFSDRVAGASKLSRRIVFEAMLVVWKLRLARGEAGKRGRLSEPGAEGPG
jgi:dolichol-phosphate mannosyltransferase